MPVFVDDVVMELDELFIDTVEDLRRRSHLRMTDYDATQASGLIRRLLIDGTNLLQETLRVDRGHDDLRLSVPRFHWVGGMARVLEADPDDLWQIPSLLLDPSLSSGAQSREAFEAKFVELDVKIPTKEGSAQEFLAATIIITPSNEYENVTVRELVKHYANREGGVHYGSGGKSTSNTIEHLRAYPQVELGLRQTVVACGRIVARALEPLATQLAFQTFQPFRRGS